MGRKTEPVFRFSNWSGNSRWNFCKWYLQENVQPISAMAGSRIQRITLNGQLTGEKKSFYEDTKIQEEALYKNGVRHGLSKWYKQNGKPSLNIITSKAIYRGQQKNMTTMVYWSAEGNYVANNEEGEWKVYQDSVLQKKSFIKPVRSCVKFR